MDTKYKKNFHAKKVPVQSDSVPLINIYFTVCIVFSLASMVWFSILNNLREKSKKLEETNELYDKHDERFTEGFNY
jgi:hypothetical protein